MGTQGSAEFQKQISRRIGSLQTPGQSPYQSEILSTASELSSFAVEFANLDGFAACPMQSYRWIQACALSFTEDRHCIVVLRYAGEVVGCAAFSQPAAENRLLPLGHELFEPTIFSCADEAACEELLITVLELNQSIFLRDVYGALPMSDAVKAACVGKRICIERPMPAHPWLKLDQTWLDPEQHLNSGRRSDLRRARRQAEKQGVLSFLIERPNAENVDALMDEVFEVESRNWKGRTGSAMAYSPAIQRFYRTYARMAAEQGIARVLMMRVGDKTVAVQFGVEFNRRFWLLKMGYDETYSRCSPGMLLMVESLRHATECGLEIYEMMGVRESWNQVWTEHAHEAVSLRIYAPGMRGMLGASSDVVRAGLRRAIAKTEATRATEKSAPEEK